jgi:SPP1 gp7 family putative phage head morphogenesis protein
MFRAASQRIESVWELPLEEAAAWFLDRTPLPQARFDAQREVIRAKYFTVARQQSELVLSRIQEQVASAIEEGVDRAEFVGRIQQMLRDAGISPLEPWHADLVYNQNLSTAYQAGKYDLTFSPEVEAEFPALEYVTVGDDFVRPAHAAMNGRVFRRDDPVWREWYPPNGFNCRCQVIALRAEEVRDVDDAPPLLDERPVAPDPGFDETPSEAYRRAV